MRTKGEYAILPWVVNQMTCTVTLTGRDGVQHSVEVTAETLYEAAVRGLREMKLSDWTREETYDATNVLIAARTPVVVHTVPLGKLKQWLARSAGSPREVALRSHLKGLL